MARIFQRRNRVNSQHRDDWVMDFVDENGKRRFVSTRQKNKRVAQELLNDIQTKVARREFLGIIEESGISFREYSAQWLGGLRPDLALSTRVRREGIIEQHLKPYFHELPLRKITPSYVADFVKQRVEQGASASSINHEVGVIKMMLRRAVSEELLGRNPLLDNQGRLREEVRPLREPAGRVRYLAPVEIPRLLEACASVPCLKPFVQVALNTGMRRNEILSLTRGMLDRDNRLVRLTQTKTGAPRIVHLNKTALEAIDALPRRLDGKLFGFGPNAVSVAFLRAARRAKIEDFRLHDLRHTFASYQAMNGMHGKALQDLLGHQDSRMTARYTHLSGEFLRAAVEGVQLGGEVETEKSGAAS